MKLLLAGCLFACTLFLSKCQDPDINGCPLIQSSDMGSTSSPSTTGLIAESYITGDNPTPPNVEVLSFNIVCRSASKNVNMWRGVSVVVAYTCDGSAECNGTTLLSQFDLTCIGGQWQLIILGTNSISGLRTTPSDASATTPMRTDCSICVSPSLGSDLGVIPSVDPITHCADCHSACSVGLMECVGFTSLECCNYYQAGICVINCTPTHVVDPTTNVCVCPGFFTGAFCTECGLVCENGGSVQDMAACSVCDCPSGYEGTTCGDDVNECDDVSSNLCMNSATCVNTLGGFTCACADGFSGDLCQDDICSPTPCQNGGTCSVMADSFECDCPPGFFDERCQRDVCTGDPCSNGGTCVIDTDGSSLCQCVGNWVGDACTVCSIESCERCGSAVGVCEECKERFELKDQSCVCQSGYVLFGNDCVKNETCLVANCQDCAPENIRVCVKCLSGYSVNTTSGSCIVSEDGPSGGLSEGAIIGIIIGCIIGFVALVLVIVCVLVGVYQFRDPLPQKPKHEKIRAPPTTEKPKLRQSATASLSSSAHQNPLFGGGHTANAAYAYFEKEAEFTVKEEVEEDEEGDDISLTRIEEEEEEEVVVEGFDMP